MTRPTLEGLSLHDLPHDALVAWLRQGLPSDYEGDWSRWATHRRCAPGPVDLRLAGVRLDGCTLGFVAMERLPHETHCHALAMERWHLVSCGGGPPALAWREPITRLLEETTAEAIWLTTRADGSFGRCLRASGFAVGHAMIVWSARPDEIADVPWGGDFDRARDEECAAWAAEAGRRMRHHRYAFEPVFEPAANERLYEAVVTALWRGDIAADVFVARTKEGGDAGFGALQWLGPEDSGLCSYRFLMRAASAEGTVVASLLSEGARRAGRRGARHLTSGTSVGNTGMIQQALATGFRIDHVTYDWFWFRGTR